MDIAVKIERFQIKQNILNLKSTLARIVVLLYTEVVSKTPFLLSI